MPSLSDILNAEQAQRRAQMTHEPFTPYQPAVEARQGIGQWAQGVGERSSLGGMLGAMASEAQRYQQMPAGELAGQFGPSGGMAGMIKTPFGRIPETTIEVDKFADWLKNKGENLGYNVGTGSSNVSNSRYVTFKTPESDYQVRLSGHGDRYGFPEGERFSVDPNSLNTFEMAKDWLKEKGINLDKRVAKQNTIPTNYLKGAKVSEINALRKARGGAVVTPKEVAELGLIDDIGMTQQY